MVHHTYSTCKNVVLYLFKLAKNDNFMSCVVFVKWESFFAFYFDDPSSSPEIVFFRLIFCK